MQIHSLSLDDFSDSNYQLIGIHCSLEDYRLAYILNLHLHLDFKRCKFDIDFKNKKQDASFSLYEYFNEATDNSWYLISNVYKTKIKNNNKASLFSENETRIRLISEKKRVDYFLKIEGNFCEESMKQLTEKMNTISQIITSYTIDANQLKSKEVLIF